MSLKTLESVLKTYPVKTQAFYAADGNLPEFRERAQAILKKPDNFLVVNYLRKKIKQESGGHISPIAAYHQGEDLFLILDVARYKYGPVWVKADALWQAMQDKDGASGKSRGYVTVELPESRAP